MTDISRDSQGYSPDLNKHPNHAGDDFVPYTPPIYGDPRQPQYSVPQYSVPQYSVPQSRPPQYPAPPALTPQYPAPQPGAVAATRALGAVAVVGALLLIAYGWLSWASFDPKYSDIGSISVNGWGQVFEGDSQVTMYAGGTGTPYAATFIPFFVLPVVVLGLLVLCNIGRFGNSIAISALAIGHLLLSLAFLAAPSMCILFDNSVDTTLFEEMNTFSIGPGAILATVTLMIVVGSGIAGIILGRRKIYPPAPVTPGHGGYRGY